MISMGLLRSLFDRIVQVLAMSYVLMFFSEYFFLNEEPTFNLINSLVSSPGEAISGVLLFAIFYAIPTYLFLFTMDRYRVNGIWSLFLAGCIFGWSVEGILIPYVYAGLPVTIVWPPLGWHAVVDVLLGWYLIRTILRKGLFIDTILVSIALGLFWGVWATWFWVGEADKISPINFAVFSLFTATLLILSYALLDGVHRRSFKGSKFEIIAVSLLALFFLGTWTIMMFGLPLIVLAPILVITIIPLMKNSKKYKGPTILESFRRRTSIRFYPILFLTPLIASIEYAIIFHSGLEIPVVTLVFPLILVSMVLYVISWIRSFQQKG